MTLLEATTTLRSEMENPPPKKRGVKPWPASEWSTKKSTEDFVILAGGPRNGSRVRRRWWDHLGQCHTWDVTTVVLPGLLDDQGRSMHAGFYVYEPESDRMVWKETP